MELENTVLSETSQTEGALSVTYVKSKRRNQIQGNNETSGCQGLGLGEEEYINRRELNRSGN